MKGNWYPKISIALVMLIALRNAGHAQVTTATVSGIVTDGTGGVTPWSGSDAH